MNVAQLMAERTGSFLSVVFAERFLVYDHKKPDAHVSGELLITKSTRGVLVSVSANATLKSVCSKCLITYDNVIALKFEESYIKTENIDRSTDFVGTDSDFEDHFVIAEDKILDFGEALRQHTLAAIPINPICRVDCQGLCKVCGSDLNYGKCHDDGDLLSPWLPLKKLLEDTGKNN